MKTMNGYPFFTAQLRFVAAKTHRENDDIDQMMNVLHSIADQIDEGGMFQIQANRIRLGARALAGVAGFLQQHILPEVISQKNLRAEKQIRWSIDTSMSLMAKMMTHAELTHDKDPLKLTLDAPPDL